MSGDSHNTHERPRVLLVMGVSGAGKSTVGKIVAERLGYQFIEGDDFHPLANREKLCCGIPLNDIDREPWLRALRSEIEWRVSAKVGVVLACSALKESYRRILLEGLESQIIYLRVPASVLSRRMALRQGHFASPQILESQLQTLEEPDLENLEVAIFDGAAELFVLMEQVLSTLLGRVQEKS